MAKTDDHNNDIIHRLRNHIQIVGGLLRLHSDHVEIISAPELLAKLRTRLAALEESSFLTVERPHEPAAVRPVIETIANAVSRIYSVRSRHRCVVDGGDFHLEAVELAVAGQIFAEYLSTIYSGRSLRNVATDVVTTITQDAAGVVRVRVRDLNFAPGEDSEPVDALTSRVVAALVSTLGADARSDAASIFDACLTFKSRVALRTE